MACTGLALFIFVIANYFAGNFMPGEFGKLGRSRACLGCFLRLFVALITLAHWFLIVPHFFFLLTYMVTATECFIAGLGVTKILLLLMPVIWLIQHVGGAVVRSFIDIDSFLVIPDSASGNKLVQVIFVHCGP